MDGKEYLQQISASTRPVAKSKVANFMSSTMFKVIAGGIVAFFIIMIIGIVLSGGKGDLKTRTLELKLHLEKTAEVITTYQNNIKSSNLRSSSASMYSVLSNTSREMDEYLVEKYAYKSGSDDKELEAEAEAQRIELDDELFSAKINGILDRIFAHKMDYEISLLLVEENDIYNSSSDSLRSIMQTSMDSLRGLQDSFTSFSETK